MTIAVVVVSFRNNPELTSFLRHLEEFSPHTLEHVVAVANGLDTASILELEHQTSQILRNRLRLCARNHNPGYFGGARDGRAILEQAGIYPDWLIVCNDDVRFSANFFHQLQRYTPTTQLGLIAPDILLTGSGTHQNPLYVTQPSILRLWVLREIHRSVCLIHLFLRLRKYRRPRKRPTSGPRSIYAAHGSCLLFSRTYFDSGGSLDYPAFLYGEEFFVAENACDMGLEIRFEPALLVHHNEHSTTGALPSAQMALYVRQALHYAIRRMSRRLTTVQPT